MPASLKRSILGESLRGAHLFRLALLLTAAAALLVPAPQRSAAYLALEESADLLILLLVLRGGQGRGPALTVSVAALLAADTLYALMYLVPGFPPALFQVQVAAYLIYSVSAALFLGRAYLSSGPRRTSGLPVLAALFICFTALQIKYVALPASSGIYSSPYIYLLTTAHRVAESAVLALAVMLGMKASSRYWFCLLNAFILLPLSSFAIGYSTTTANGVPFAEYGWVLGLFSLLAAQTYPAGEGEAFARWNSIRVRLVWFVSSITAGLLVLLYLLQAFVNRDVFHLTAAFFFTMFGVWLVANLIAFRVYEDVRSLLDGLRPDGSSTARAAGKLTIYEADLFAARLSAAYAAMREQAGLAALSSVSAQVAHDIRSPLSALDSALKDLPELPAERRSLIEAASSRIKDIADDLLERNRAGGRPAPARPAALAPLIEAVLAEKRAQFAARRGVRITADIQAGVSAVLRPAEFSRVLSNLVNNGVEALDGAGSVTVSLGVDGGSALITVKDDGRGIPADILAGLGGRGFTRGKEGGNGLGLYHARSAVEGWGGSLSITSPGKGAAVVIRLPSVVLPAEAALLDDDELVHMTWRAAARKAGVELRAYKDAAALLAAAGELPKNLPLYIDSDLGAGAPGEAVAEEMRRRGFTDITMATGHGPERFAAFPWLKVSGKEPPWETAG